MRLKKLCQIYLQGQVEQQGPLPQQARVKKEAEKKIIKKSQSQLDNSNSLVLINPTKPQNSEDWDAI